MLHKYSAKQIVRGQIKALVVGEARPFRALLVFFALPIISPLVQCLLGLHLTESLVGIDISAAAIFAGLLLNLLVVVYGLAPTQSVGALYADEKSVSELRELVEITFYSISYAVLICGVLVAAAILVVTGIQYVMRVAELFVYYFGAQLILAILLILRLCHGLLEHRLTPMGRWRAQESDEIWNKKG
ncbi:hypothetical protein [Ideonella sp. BN130291]|uniref:hypothetical protein n=1 Tax=Ideonella sp. BN130291 TaxID=3112940 RepID=UPI002E27279F|nr:hypothetical protein [Ideonella sp. BN130291]